MRKELIKNSIKRFNIEDDFDVLKQTICTPIKAVRLTIFGPGCLSVVLLMEVTLNAIVISVWEHNHPLTCGKVIQAVNSLIEGTPFAVEIIHQRKAQRSTRRMTIFLAVADRGYSQRNSEIVTSKVRQKFACMQAQNCTYQSLAKNCDAFQHGHFESGDAVLLETSMHMNSSGDVIKDISKTMCTWK